MTLASMRELFANPPMDVRPAPFWFWNDHLEPERLRWQFDQLLEAGAGGAVLHARTGLPPAEYLDESWFAAITAVVERAAERGAVIWLYDELGWPSGAAGGRIPGIHPEMRMVHLHMDDLIVGEGEPLRDWSDIVAAFHVTRTDSIHGFQRRHDGSASLFPDRIRYEALPSPLELRDYEGSRVLVFRRAFLDKNPNYFDPKVTGAFIECTHEEYFRRLAPHFGSTIRYSFMDEPGMRGGPASLPWDNAFEDDFLARRGYPLLPSLPALFFDTPGCEAVRFDYWSLVAEKFREGFIIPIHEWCQAHGIASSGHVDFEATLKEAVRQTGSPMPIYEHQGMVGIDILGSDFYSKRIEQEAYGYYLVTIKQAASVNRQLAKGGVMSESYGVGGHAMGPESMQIATNFQMALGVTFLCQHAPFYSIRGERKYDCPPFIDWREPYWPFVRKHFDAVSRIGWLLNQGQPVCDVLLLHPMASIQATYRLMRKPEERKAENYLLDADLPFEVIEKHFTLLSSALLDAQIDHDYGDEEILARHGCAENGRLRVGAMSYRFVVLPPLVNIRVSTVNLLREFVAQGGTLLVVGSAPCLVDGESSSAATTVIEDARVVRVIDGVDRFDYAQIIARLTTWGGRTVLAKDDVGEDVAALKAQRRKCDGAEVFYLANISRENVLASLTFVPSVSGVMEEWDIGSGSTRAIGTCTAGEEIVLDVEWAAGQARVLLAGDAPLGPDVSASPVRVSPVKRHIELEWNGQRTQPNALVLDQCRVVGQESASTPMSTWQARDLLKKRIREEGGAVSVVLEYPFTVSAQCLLLSACTLAVESANAMKITFNDQDVPLHISGTHLDPAIQCVELPSCHSGENSLRLAAVFSDANELQSPLILGAFRLSTQDYSNYVLEMDDGSMGLGSWAKQGAPFYAGMVTYRASLELTANLTGRQLIIDMPGLLGSARVRVNGATVDHVLWPPYCCDVSDALKTGMNTIEIEVANTLRNLFGPHYEPNEANMPGPSDDSYRGIAGERKYFRDYGLMRAPELIVRVSG